MLLVIVGGHHLQGDVERTRAIAPSSVELAADDDDLTGTCYSLSTVLVANGVFGNATRTWSAPDPDNENRWNLELEGVSHGAGGPERVYQVFTFEKFGEQARLVDVDGSRDMPVDITENIDRLLEAPHHRRSTPVDRGSRMAVPATSTPKEMGTPHGCGTLRGHARTHNALFAAFFAINQRRRTNVVPLCGRRPGFESRRDEPEQHQDWWYKNIHNPSLTVFLPPAGRNSGTAVIVAAGGGHRELVFNPEGVEPAQYLASLGITAFALKYRLFREPGSKYTIDNTAEDIRRAMRTVRARSAEWGVDPKRIGVMGWSAGGEVAALVAYPPVPGNPSSKDPVERVSARPDFQILIYPGPLGIPDTMPPDAPPLFLLGAADDEYVAGVLFDLTRKYHAAGASIETHIYTQGKHAFNMGQRSDYVSIRNWPQRLAEWLQDRGYTRGAP
jgi:acetyl esterase/lipase